MIRFSREEFETAVDDAIDLIPDDLFQAMENVVILIEPEPPGSQPHLLGLYEGVPLTHRDSSWTGSLPDTIRIFQGPLERMCSSRSQLVQEIKVTVVHEIAHFFGIPESRLHELGWG